MCGEGDTGARVVGLTKARCAGRGTLGLGWWDSRMQGVQGGGVVGLTNARCAGRGTLGLGIFSMVDSSLPAFTTCICSSVAIYTTTCSTQRGIMAKANQRTQDNSVFPEKGKKELL